MTLQQGTHAQALPRARTEQPFRVTSLANGLEHPWGMAFLPDGSILVTERPGRLRLVTANGLDPQPIAGVPEVVARGQGGLLDVVLHPEYDENGWIYLAYSAAETPGSTAAGTRVARARLGLEGLYDLEVIFDMARKTPAGQHFGARLAFDEDGLLYIATGDRGEPDRAQDLGDHAGKVLRLTDSGGIPADNPFVNQAGALPEVYTYGNRNIQGLTRHPETGAIWSHEHGPRGGDEINILAPGVNYGWPLISHGREYTGGPVGEGRSEAPGLASPLLHWTPSIAPSGMTFYTGEAFPEWQGNLFVGALAGQHLARLQLEGDQIVAEERLLEGAVGRIRDVRQGPDGLLYLLTDAPNGSLLRLEPAS
ncbi:PQQ-dependent sugar dehydrogenase [Synechococcus bigranulatus str. 'Rupite']|uniref:PQQ-dependent sugar dehydrogenase n=2 Tax=Thermostichus vulcanus TaxID=32053 RepID=A0ABT0CC24_THEVL|nr:PQQ-dependent sugar dehydrogenase [Thermostichus vulcanus str. 'Rupite']